MIEATENPIKLYDLIAVELKKVDLELDESKLKAGLNFTIPDEKKVIERIKRLVSTVNDIKDDFDAKREAYRILRHLYEANILNCLADNASYFKLIKPQLNSYDQAVCCLQASLIGATDIAELLFDKICNPRKNTYIISYAIFSGNNKWIKELVAKWKIDITDPEYCFMSYSKKFDNHDLAMFFNEEVLRKNNLEKISNPLDSRSIGGLDGPCAALRGSGGRTK